MIERLRARHFQAHESLDVTFDLVTTLTGATDVGKSSVLRAVRWVCMNQPAGTDFITHDHDCCSVRLDVDGHAVVRKQGKDNVYKLDDVIYKAFGRSVPDPITEVLNVGEVNFQQQLDAPFWLSLPPPQLSRELNAVVSLESIDSTLANVAAEVRRAKAAVEVTEERLAQAQKELNDLDWVPDMLESLGKIEATHARIADVALQRDRLQGLWESYQEAKRSRQRAAQANDAAAPALATGLRLEAVERDFVRLQALYGDLRHQRRQAAELRDRARQAEEEFHKEVGETCPVCGATVT